MALKIRMRRQGRTNRPFYRMVVTDSRNRREGRYVEMLGWYNPLEAEPEKNLFLDGERVQHWIEQGAVLSEKAEALVTRAAPTVIEKLRDKRMAHRAKLAAKRKENNKTKA